MSKVSEHIKSGKMWLNSDGKWCKRCPSCNTEIVCKDGSITTKFNVSHSIIKQQVCHSCIKIGKPTWTSLHKEEWSNRISGTNHPFYGKKHSDEFKERQRRRYIGTSLSDDTKEKLSIASKKAWKNPKIKQKYVDALCKTKWIKVRTDKGQIELLNKWNLLGFSFEPNYQLKVGNEIFYLDGYDPIHNVVLEYDSKYHNKESQKFKDMERQIKIINYLKPKRFWRYIYNKTLFIECSVNRG